MQLILKNINLIQDARIRLNGLTVIAGENDSGKSTVGKLLFSIIKAFSQYDKSLSEDKIINIQEQIENIYRQVRKTFRFEDNPGLKEIFFPTNFFQSIRKIIEFTAAPYQADEIKTIFDKKAQLLESATPLSEEHHNVTNIQQDIKILSKRILKLLADDTVGERIRPVLNRILASEFNNELIPKHSEERQAHIALSEGDNAILALTIDTHGVQHLEISDPLLFNDASFIETPIILQLYDLINTAHTLPGDSFGLKGSHARLPYHLADLISKLKNAQYVSDSLMDGDEPLFAALQNTHALMRGGFNFDDSDKDFIFRRGYGQEQSMNIKPVNTASGIKAFGIIQLLIHAGMLNTKSLLIVDEPETHLHPAWQVEYARLMIMLVQQGIPVLLTSHSPYIIQALKVAGEAEGLGAKMNYYLAECEPDGFASMHDVSNDLNRIFVKLSAPMQELVWQQ
ncbi:AAA family ATPase [Candidatus Venteria ishoeyi]|uniref:AAA family ATPase n=1 Tax=Candidatus Venteria ishoeyi TaxID=1899563 RepID=UPI0025A5A43E|nr:AAA family ATPase [Candidatus Venteria ishoeyi]MDM8548352.1 AAA family ATPase [Candidatus Venteria ishoeyi]